MRFTNLNSPNSTFKERKAARILNPKPQPYCKTPLDCKVEDFYAVNFPKTRTDLEELALVFRSYTPNHK